MADKNKKISDDIFFALADVTTESSTPSSAKDNVIDNKKLTNINKSKLKEGIIFFNTSKKDYFSCLQKALFKEVENANISKQPQIEAAENQEGEEFENQSISKENNESTFNYLKLLGKALKFAVKIVKLAKTVIATVFTAGLKTLSKCIKIVGKILAKTIKVILKTLNKTMRALFKALKIVLKNVFKFIKFIVPKILRGIFYIIGAIIKMIVWIFTPKEKKTTFFKDVLGGSGVYKPQIKNVSMNIKIDTSLDSKKRETSFIKIKKIKASPLDGMRSSLKSKREFVLWKYVKKIAGVFFKATAKAFKTIIGTAVKKLISIVIKTIIKFFALQALNILLPAAGAAIAAAVSIAFFTIEMYNFIQDAQEIAQSVTAMREKLVKEESNEEIESENLSELEKENDLSSDVDLDEVVDKVFKSKAILDSQHIQNMRNRLQELADAGKKSTGEYFDLKQKYFQQIYNQALLYGDREEIARLEKIFNVRKGLVDARYTQILSVEKVMESSAHNLYKNFKRYAEESKINVMAKDEINDMFFTARITGEPDWTMPISRAISFVSHKINDILSYDRYKTKILEYRNNNILQNTLNLSFENERTAKQDAIDKDEVETYTNNIVGDWESGWMRSYANIDNNNDNSWNPINWFESAFAKNNINKYFIVCKSVDYRVNLPKEVSPYIKAQNDILTNNKVKSTLLTAINEAINRLQIA